MVGNRISQEWPIGDVLPNSANYRNSVDADHLAELVQSILMHGILVPLMVRRVGDGKSQVIAGDTRLLAAKEASKETVPVIVHEGEVTEDDVLAMNLAEQLLHKNPNPADTARGFDRLLKLSGLDKNNWPNGMGSAKAWCRSFGRC